MTTYTIAYIAANGFRKVHRGISQEVRDLVLMGLNAHSQTDIEYTSYTHLRCSRWSMPDGAVWIVIAEEGAPE